MLSGQPQFFQPQTVQPSQANIGDWRVENAIIAPAGRRTAMTNPRIGVCSWSLQADSPRPLVQRLRGLEIPAVQLALGPVLGEPSIWGGVADELRSADISIMSGMIAMAAEDYATLESIRRTGGVRPDHAWPANLEHAAAAARFAAGEAISLVTFHAGFLPTQRDDPTRQVMLDRLGAIADLFAHHGVDVALETGQETAETLAGVLAELDRPHVGVNFDPANMILYGMSDPVTALRALVPHVKQIHIKDALPAETPGTWGTEVPVGHGAVDWDAFFGVALTVSPEMNFVIERESGGNRDSDIASARDLIASQLSEE